MSESTLNEVLLELGYRTTNAKGSMPGRKHIIDKKTEETIFTGRVGEVWDWLRENDRL